MLEVPGKDEHWVAPTEDVCTACMPCPVHIDLAPTGQAGRPKGGAKDRWLHEGCGRYCGAPAAAQLLPLLLLGQEHVRHVLADDGAVGLGDVVGAVLGKGKDGVGVPEDQQQVRQ
jgi:hypothetical protein